MKTWGRDSRRSGMWKPRRHVRSIEQRCRPTCYSTRKATWDCGKCTSEDHLSQLACPAHAGCESGPEAGRKQLFSGSDGGLSRGIWTGPFTGFSTSSTLTLWILSEHSKPQPAWCALPLFLYSVLTQHLHPFTGRNSCGHSPLSMRTSSWMACARSCQPMAYLALAECVSFEADSMADLAAICQRKSSRVETERR